MSDGNFDNSGGSDVFVERTSQSWFGRIGDAFKSILFGLILVIVAAILLFWNEGRAAHTAAALAEGAGRVVSVDASRVDPVNEGKLVHLSGPTSLAAPVADADFRFGAEALKLDRTVEMYQWKEEKHTETHKNLGGSEETVTRYTYAREWSDKAVESGGFREANGHRNPQFPRVGSRAFYPEGAKLGAFAIGAKVLAEVEAKDAFAPPPAALAGARTLLGSRTDLAGGGVFSGADPDHPQVGDVRVTWRIAPVGELSVVGAQTGGAVAPSVAHNGEEVLLVESGDVDATSMFKHGEEANAFLTWVLRGAGVLVMFIGFRVAMTLVEVLADVVPLFGSIVGAGASLVALFCTLVLAPLIVAVAWLFYRPLTAVLVLAVGAGLAYFVHARARARVAARPG